MKQDTNTKPIVKITKNSLVYFFNPDGTRNQTHPNGFFFECNLEFYHANYLVIDARQTI